MGKKLVIWIVGSNGAGKTTLAINLHEYFASLFQHPVRKELIKLENDCFYTKFSNVSCNLGKLIETQCGGTDTLGTKEQIENTFKTCLKHFPVIIIEGIMATGKWIEFLKTPETVVINILLNFSIEKNIERIEDRRYKKKGVEVITTQKTLENVWGKLKGFLSLYNRMKEKVDYSIELFTDDLSEDEVKEIVIEKIENFFHS